MGCWVGTKKASPLPRPYPLTSAITTRRLNYRYHRPLRAGHYGRWCRWWLQWDRC